jgi:hypothetical protein
MKMVYLPMNWERRAVALSGVASSWLILEG